MRYKDFIKEGWKLEWYKGDLFVAKNGIKLKLSVEDAEEVKFMQILQIEKELHLEDL